MTHDPLDSSSEKLSDIVAADETRTSVLRQIVNGVSGLLVLLVTGLVVVLLVLWKAP